MARVTLQGVLSVLLVLGFLGFCLIVGHKEDMTKPSQVALVLATTLVNGFNTAIAFWLGSSAGSAKKTDVLLSNTTQGK